jgi:hypothetical protein
VYQKTRSPLPKQIPNPSLSNTCMSMRRRRTPRNAYKHVWGCPAWPCTRGVRTSHEPSVETGTLRRRCATQRAGCMAAPGTRQTRCCCACQNIT